MSNLAINLPDSMEEIPTTGFRIWKLSNWPGWKQKPDSSRWWRTNAGAADCQSMTGNSATTVNGNDERENGNDQIN